MSGPRITRKVTVEVSKKVTESGSVPSSVVQPSSSSSYNPRRSVFERLGPGAIDRNKSRESYPPDKCRNWLRDGRCPYGNNCKFLHGPYSDQKPRTKSVRSIVSSGSKDRHEDSDEKMQQYHSRSQDSIEYDEEDEEQELIKKKKRRKSDDDLSDTPKKTMKSKKKHKEEQEDEDEDRKAKRKRKTHKKRDSSPKSKHRSPKEDEEDWDAKASMVKDFEQQMKDAENWEDQGGEMDYDRQLELERRRQDLQRQLALIDEQDAAASAEDTSTGQWKGHEKEDEPKKVPIVHSRLHPEPSAGTPSDDGSLPQLTTTKKKKKKKLDSEGEGTKGKKKKEGSPRKKEEPKRKVIAKEEDMMVRKEIPLDVERVKKDSTSDETTELLEQHQTKKKIRKTPKSSAGASREKHIPEGSPPREQPIRKRVEEEEYRHQEGLSPQAKPPREKRKSESAASSDEPVARRTEEGRSRKSRDTTEYYPSPDEQEDTRKVRSRVVGPTRRAPSNERQRAVEGRSEGRPGRREAEERVTSRGPRTPSPPAHAKREDERFYYEDAAEEAKRKRPTRTRSPVREPAREDGYRKDGTDRDRARHEDPHGRGPRTPSDEEAHLSPPPNQAEATRSNRFSEREKELPRRDMSRERGPPHEQGDQRYPDRGGRGHPDSDFDRRRPRDEEVSRGRRPPPRADDYPRGRPQDDDHPRHRGRDDEYPRDTRDEEFPRHREGREDEYQKPKYRDDRPEEYPPRSRVRGERDEGEFLRGRGRDDRGEEVRGRPPPRDVHRRPHDEAEGNERDLRDERGRGRTDGYVDSRSRERPDDRSRDPRYDTPEHYRRPSPSQGPPRGRSPPPHRYDDRRRVDEGYRGGPAGGRDTAVGRGRGYDRGRGEYSSPYDSRARPVDTRRRTPPPGPRASFQDRDRGPPRGRDAPVGRGRGYVDKGRPPNDRFRDPGAPWERRPDRDYRDHRKPFEEPGMRDRHSRDSSPPPPGFRDQRPWEDRDRRGSPPRGGNVPPQDRRPPYDAEHDGRGRPEPRERRSLERGAEGWEYENDVNQRKRPRPTTTVSSRPGSPFEPKKLREQSPADFDTEPSLADIPAAPEEPIRTKKATAITKKIKKKKLGKKDGKAAKAGMIGEGSIEPIAGAVGAEEGKIIKGEKKLKKEKKLKEKGMKKKKKIAGTSAVTDDTVTAVAEVEEPVMLKQAGPETNTTAGPKIGKKRKQTAPLEGEQPPEKDAEKPKKKKKKKHQPEVVVQPWADLEEEEDEAMEAKKDDKETKEDDQDMDDKPLATEKSADEMFSDWSDGDSPVGEDTWIDDNDDQKSPVEQKTGDTPSATPTATPTVVAAKSSPLSEERGPSFDDVYDPISDDEFEAMYTQSDEEEEEKKKEKKDSKSALGIEDVDWSSLGLAQQPKKEKEPLSHLEKFTPGHVFRRIGISPNLAGQRLTQLVQEACAKTETDTSKQETANELSIPEEGPKCIGAFVAAAAAKRREREALLGNLGPCRRALCARRDLAMRKQLGRSSKFGKVALFTASQSTPVGPPVDNELFQMSVALYKKDSTNTDISTRIIPSKVGSILLTQA